MSRGLEAIAERPDEVENLYADLPAISIDHAVMERCDDLVSLPLDADWSDLGSWEALGEVLPADDSGNVECGDVVRLGGRDNLLFADRGTIAVFGVSDLVVVQTGDSVLVAPKSRSQEVKELVQELRRRGREDLL